MKRIKIVRKILVAGMMTVLALLIADCEVFSSTGVCTGYSAEYNSTYCKDGWTEEECQEWDDLQVNGVSWNYYKGQTCEERGTPATP